MALNPFNILSYSPNPAFYQIGQAVTISPLPGFSGASFTLSGTLPLGLAFNTTTGVISGTPTTLTEATTLTITGTNVNSSTSTVTVIISVIDIPAPALEANQASATSLTSLRQTAEQNFITSVEQIINNNNSLGKFTAYFDIPQYVSFKFIMNYFNNLNYIVRNLYPSNNTFQFVSEFAGFPDAPPVFLNNGFETFDDFAQPFPLVRPTIQQRVQISWTPFPGYFRFPYGF